MGPDQIRDAGCGCPRRYMAEPRKIGAEITPVGLQPVTTGPAALLLVVF